MDTTSPGQFGSLAFEFDLRHPPAKVWRALTTPELLKEWLLPVVGLELLPGADFQFKTDPHPGWDGTVNCSVLEFEQERKLKYSWVVGAMELRTTVTFTLTPTETGTHLTLVHAGFLPQQKQNFGGARYGWRLMGEKLVALLDHTSAAQ